jgi:MFS family permease
MLLGLGASLIGAVLFAIAPNVWFVLVGRAFMGVGIGLTVGPSTAAILEFSSQRDARRAASLTMIAQATLYPGLARGWCVDGVRSLAHAALLLRTCGVAGSRDGRDVVSSAP